MNVRVAIASDHAGYDLKQAIVAFVRDDMGAEIEDLGTHSLESCDYPEYAFRVAEAVAAAEADLGILICGTGIGMSIAANKVAGAFAAHCSTSYSARMARQHNAANVLCMGARVIGLGVAEDIVREFLTQTPITDEPRYVRRREQVVTIQNERGSSN